MVKAKGLFSIMVYPIVKTVYHIPKRVMADGRTMQKGSNEALL